MKPLSLGHPIGNSPEAKLDWIIDAIRQIELASQEETTQIFDSYSFTDTLTETRTFDVSSATLSEIRSVLATLIDDHQRRGVNRREPT